MKTEINQSNYDQLIFSWYKRSTEEDYFSKFIFLYLDFNASLMKKFFVNSREDRQEIESLKKADKIKETYFSLIEINREIVVSFESLIIELQGKHLRNTSRNKGEIKEIIIKDAQDWSNLIEFVYTVRNNLFHGTKNPEEFRDWSMVCYAYILLKPLAEIMISYQAFHSNIEDYGIKRMKEMMKK